MGHANARRLHQCVLQFEDERLEQATLLPFFDANGNVEQVLLIDLWWRRVHLLPFKPGLVRLSIFRRNIRVRCEVADAPLLDDRAAQTLGDLWHFDPWWLLELPPFDVEPTTPLLKRTNCADLLPVSKPQLCYSRDLARVAWLFDGKSESSGTRWNSTLLPAQRPEPTEASRRPVATGRVSWVLDPVWMRS